MAFLAAAIGSAQNFFPWIVYLAWIPGLLAALFVVLAIGQILAAPFNRNARIVLTDDAIQQFTLGNKPRAVVPYDLVRNLSFYDRNGGPHGYIVTAPYPVSVIAIDDNVEQHEFLIRTIEERTGKTFENEPTNLPKRPNLGRERGA